MKQTALIAIFSLVLVFRSSAQTEDIGANLTGITVTPVAGSIYEVSGSYNDPAGVSDGTDVAVGDVLWSPATSPGDTCREFVITQMVAPQFGGFITFRVDVGSQGAPSTQNSIIQRHTNTFDLPFVPATGSDGLRQCIAIRLSRRIDKNMGAGGSGGTVTTQTEIDGDGSPGDPLGFYGFFLNHNDAATNGVPIGGTYKASEGNTMGSPYGALIIRTF